MVPSAALVTATWCHAPPWRRADELISRRDLYSGAQLLGSWGEHSVGRSLHLCSWLVAQPSERLPRRKLRPYAPPGPGPPHEARPTPPSQLSLPCSTCAMHSSSHLQSSRLR